MWRVHCRLFGPDGDPRWFVVRDHADGTQYLKNKNGRPMPFADEWSAERAAIDLNANQIPDQSFDYADFDARR